ncbi:MAG: hypothetical protein ACREIA_07275 [Opitutaceae bacterium]
MKTRLAALVAFLGLSLALTAQAQSSGSLEPKQLIVVNSSIRGFLDYDEILIPGFVISGEAGTVLIRGIGPGLFAHGVQNYLPDPIIQVFDAEGNVIGENDNWGADYDKRLEIDEAVEAAGAFELVATQSKDAALLITLPAGPYTVSIRSATRARGEVLCEIYTVPEED